MEICFERKADSPSYCFSEKSSEREERLDLGGRAPKAGALPLIASLEPSVMGPKLCRSRAEKSMYSAHRSIEGCLQLIENTGLHVHRILCIASAHQRCRRKMRFSLGSEISSRSPLCNGLSMNALDFGDSTPGFAELDRIFGHAYTPRT